MWGGWILAVLALALSPLVWAWVSFATLPCRPEESSLGRSPFVVATLVTVLVVGAGPYLLVRRAAPRRWRRWAWALALLATSYMLYGCAVLLRNTLAGSPPTGWCF